MRLISLAALLALALAALPRAAEADTRLAAGPAGLDARAAALHLAGYYTNRRYPPYGRGSNTIRRPRFDHRRRLGPADGYGTAPRSYGYRRDPRFRQFRDPYRPSGRTIRRSVRPGYDRGHARPFYRRDYRRGYRRSYRTYSRSGRGRTDYRSRYTRPGRRR